MYVSGADLVQRRFLYAANLVGKCDLLGFKEDGCGGFYMAGVDGIMEYLTAQFANA